MQLVSGMKSSQIDSVGVANKSPAGFLQGTVTIMDALSVVLIDFYENRTYELLNRGLYTILLLFFNYFISCYY